MTTILGESITEVRPRLIPKPILPKEPFKIHYNTRAHTRKIKKHEMEELKKVYEGRLNDQPRKGD